MPEKVSQPYPVIFFHGAGQTNVNWLITPDGRKGWADYFVEQGYAVYLAEQLAIIFLAMVLASILTYIIPGDSFERVVNEAGKTVVVPGSFYYIEKTPVNLFSILDYVFDGLKSAGEIIFALLCSGGGLGIVLSTGMFQGAACTLSRKAKGREWATGYSVWFHFSLLP